MKSLATMTRTASSMMPPSRALGLLAPAPSGGTPISTLALPPEHRTVLHEQGLDPQPCRGDGGTRAGGAPTHHDHVVVPLVFGLQGDPGEAGTLLGKGILRFRWRRVLQVRGEDQGIAPTGNTGRSRSASSAGPAADRGSTRRIPRSTTASHRRRRPWPQAFPFTATLNRPGECSGCQSLPAPTTGGGRDRVTCDRPAPRPSPVPHTPAAMKRSADPMKADELRIDPPPAVIGKVLRIDPQ